MAIGNEKNKIYILTIEYNPKTEEIEYIAEEVVDNKDLLTHIRGSVDIDEYGWDIETLEYMRDHYSSGEA
jgi:hypothetical protein